MRYLAKHEKISRGTFDFPIELYYVNSSHPRYGMPFHWHLECEFILIRQGSFLISVDNETFAAQAGDAVFVPSGSVHGGTPKDCVYECIVFDMERFLQDNVLCRQKLSNIFNEDYCIQTLFNAGSEAAALLSRLFENMAKEETGYEFLTTGLLWEFIGLILRHRLYKVKDENIARKDCRNSRIKNVLGRIRRDYAEPLTLETLAKEAEMTPQYLCRIFKRMTGRAPIEYLNYYRIECAAELLCFSFDSITEIAFSCGFNDPGYFARLFKRQKGITATEWRKSHFV